MSAAEPLSHTDAFVELENATVTYGQGARALNALAAASLRIGVGDFVALVGPSGCGKSTILKLITGLVRASSGYVYVSGREVGAEPMRVGMAFQNPTLLPSRIRPCCRGSPSATTSCCRSRSCRRSAPSSARSAKPNSAIASRRCSRRWD